MSLYIYTETSRDARETIDVALYPSIREFEWLNVQPYLFSYRLSWVIASLDPNQCRGACTWKYDLCVGPDR